MKQKASFLLTLLTFFALTSSVAGQEEVQLNLRLSRDIGTAIGGRIQGTFSMRVTGPDDLVRVEFFLDGAKIGEDSKAPFRIQFRTSSYDVGAHRLSAVGFTASGVELTSNAISRDFMDGGESTQLTIIIVVAVLVLAVGGRFLASRVADRGQKRSGSPAISGPFGGTICPNCGRPYALHIWAVNLVAGRLDRCPHCGKWRLVRRAPTQALEAAAERLTESSAGPSPAASITEQERLRRQLDDSRYDDAG